MFLTIHQGGMARRVVELTQKLAFGGPGDETILEKNCIACSELASVRTASPVGVGVND